MTSMLKEFQVPFSLIDLFLHVDIQQATVRSPIGLWTTVLKPQAWDYGPLVFFLLFFWLGLVWFFWSEGSYILKKCDQWSCPPLAMGKRIKETPSICYTVNGGHAAVQLWVIALNFATSNHNTFRNRRLWWSSDEGQQSLTDGLWPNTKNSFRCLMTP